VVTVHDLQHHWLPRHFSLATRLQRTALFAASFARATRIIAISDYTRADVMRRYRVPAERIVTILEGVRDQIPGDARSARATCKRLGITRPFFFYPAADHAHKNHRRLVDAFARFVQRSGIDAELVLCGARGELWKKGAAYRASELGVTDRIRHLGFLDRRDDVFALLRAARALVFPSEFEGFGLPPIEAQKVGTPVIASDCASIPEVVGAGALLLDPFDTEGWARAMERVVTDEALRERLIAQGTANVARFRWETCGAATFDTLADAARLYAPQRGLKHPRGRR
jgi:glycosyltransferase involved in cell wall biosynthesis